MDSIDEQSKITIIKVEDLCKELEECSGPRLRISQLNQEIRDGLTLLSSLSKVRLIVQFLFPFHSLIFLLNPLPRH